MMKIVRRKNQGKGLLLTSCKINGQEMHTSHEGGSMLISSKSNWYNMKSFLIFDVVIECVFFYMYMHFVIIYVPSNYQQMDSPIRWSWQFLSGPHRHLLPILYMQYQQFMIFLHIFFLQYAPRLSCILYFLIWMNDTFNIITGTI